MGDFDMAAFVKDGSLFRVAVSASCVGRPSTWASRSRFRWAPRHWAGS